MLSSSYISSSSYSFLFPLHGYGSLSPPISQKSSNSMRNFKAFGSRRHISTPSRQSCRPLHVAIPVAASVSILLLTGPVNAGFLSGFSGLESVPGPQLPEVDFLKKWNEENQKKYAEFDSRFKSSTVLKELLEKSKLNKERNRREIQEKYCLRGAEWGVGDCSTQGMTAEERDAFIETLKKNVKE